LTHLANLKSKKNNLLLKSITVYFKDRKKVL